MNMRRQSLSSTVTFNNQRKSEPNHEYTLSARCNAQTHRSTCFRTVSERAGSMKCHRCARDTEWREVAAVARRCVAITVKSLLGAAKMTNELLGPVDWSAWRRVADEDQNVPKVPSIQTVGLAHAVVIGGKAHAIGEAERVALLVLGLGRKRDQDTKAVAKAIRMALREIEQAVLSCEQDIDYLLSGPVPRRNSE